MLEEHEFGDLQGMLFMFTVCHVIIYIQEGSCFDTRVLKILRVLQSAKHALMPFLRSHNILPSLSRPSSSSSRPPTRATSSKSPSPRRGSGISSRNNSTISVMSGLGSYTALFPGQCTPVTLFAFIDDFSEMVNSSAVAEESNDSSSSSQSALSSLSRSNLPMKGSSSVVVLSRPASKFEGGLRKLHSSLEAQIRFLIKKCRTLSGPESSSYVGSRSGASSGLAPLLTLDASRAVVLLDTSSIQRGKSLDFATGLVEEVLNGKVTSDSLLLESHNLSGNKEDIMTLKEFVFRQADILRGKGGLVTNANSGSAVGVGMVAVAAAAAAAASAASGRATSVPELPSLETWLSSSQLILSGILSAKRGLVEDIDNIRRKFRQRNGAPPIAEGVATKGADPPDSAVSLLESGVGINRKFSALWCQRALPAAIEVYLKDLTSCYPTSQHESQLEKALHAFHSMVKGPSVEQFMKKLEEECLSIWKSGRQLCDAISLTGKPCMHQRHDNENDGLPSDVKGKEHSSGFVFLHACACGRSRQLRPDPFDFESANSRFNAFPDCDKLLPLFQLPNIANSGPIQPSSWTVVRLGGARYYEPSKGLLQTGFSSNYKFLLRWTIVVDKDKHSNVSFADALKQGSLSGIADGKVESTAHEDAKKNIETLVHPGEMQTGDGGHGKDDDSSKVDHKKISFGRGLPGEVQSAVEGHGKDLGNSKPERKQISFGRGLPNITMRKAFAEVVAGSASSSSAFPPLQPKMQPSLVPEKSVKKNAAKVESMDQNNVSTSDVQTFEKSADVPLAREDKSTGMSNIGRVEGNPFLHIGSNVVPLKVDDGGDAHEKNVAEGGSSRFNPSCRLFVVYVGFEHECPRGHRFILSPELLNQLVPPCSSPEESHAAHSPHLVEHGSRKHRGSSKLDKTDVHNRANRPSNGNATIIRKGSNLKRSGEVVVDGEPVVSGKSDMSKPMEQTSLDSSKPANSVADLQQSLCSVNLDDNGPAFSFLNKNLPIYLNCPHCRASKDKKDRQKLKFAGTISQLQRIFVVTPPFPIVLATNPIVQFERSCQPAGVSSREQQLQFSLGCKVILPPESFVSIRLPFVYGIEVEDKGLYPLHPFEHQPELTAWIMQGTALQVICKGSSPE